MIRLLNADVVSLSSLREFKKVGFLSCHHMCSGAFLVVMAALIVLGITAKNTSQYMCSCDTALASGMFRLLELSCVLKMSTVLDCCLEGVCYAVKMFGLVDFFVFLSQGFRAPASVAKNEPLAPGLVLLFVSVSASLDDEAPKYEFTPPSSRSDMRQYHACKCGRSWQGHANQFACTIDAC